MIGKEMPMPKRKPLSKKPICSFLGWPAVFRGLVAICLKVECPGILVNARQGLLCPLE